MSDRLEDRVKRLEDVIADAIEDLRDKAGDKYDMCYAGERAIESLQAALDAGEEEGK